jgi:hypothetical protein
MRIPIPIPAAVAVVLAVPLMQVHAKNNLQNNNISVPYTWLNRPFHTLAWEFLPAFLESPATRLVMATC